MRRFHFKHFSLCHEKSTMKVGTDSVLLGAWMTVKPTDVVLDIGTGCGVLALMAAQKGAAKIDAVDMDEPSIYEAAANFEASCWRDQLSAYHADVRRFGLGREYDLILSNPPFFVHSSPCDADRRSQTRHSEASLSFYDLVVTVKHLMKPDGRFVMVLPERESKEFITIANKNNLYIYKVLYIIPIENQETNRVNLELAFGKPERVEESSLVLRHPDGEFTEAYYGLVKDFYLGS